MLPPQDLDWAALVRWIGPASAAVARFDGLLRAMVNPAVLLAPLTTREAVLSSRIEGTRAGVSDVLVFEATGEAPDPSLRADIREIQNYRRAIALGVERLAERPLNLNTIKDIQATLMAGVPGQNGSRGRWRTVQNWIGVAGSSMETATYVPPEPGWVPGLLDDLERYLHYEEKDRLVQLAIVHGQFELIHPFVDGNGRVGRILIPLFLYEKEILSRPMFYLSAYLEAHRQAYVDGLAGLSETEAWERWITFFLQAVTVQARENSQKAQAITDLYERMKVEVTEATRSAYAIQAIDALFTRPVFTVEQFVAESEMGKPTARRIIGRLVEVGVLEMVRPGRGRQPALYEFGGLVRIVSDQPAVEVEV